MTPAALVAAQRDILAEATIVSALECVIRHACALTGAPHGSARVVGPDGLLSLMVPDECVDEHVTAVDIELRGDVLGTLRVAGAESGTRPPDVEVLHFLAGTVALVIENFRLAADVVRRDDWVRASTEITRTLLRRGNDHALTDIAQRIRTLVDADVVQVVLGVKDQERMRVDVALGPDDAAAAGREYPSDGTLSRAIIETGEPVRLADAEDVAGPEVHVNDDVRIGPVLGLPLIVAGRPRGALIIGRLQGRSAFSLAELDLASDFSVQAALALELVDSRAAQDRVAQWEDRSRIARDLHDVVIQQLFATGLGVQGLIAGPRGQNVSHALEQVVSEIDDAIGQIRISIFALQHEDGAAAGARSVVLDAVGAIAEALGRAPRVRFSGPVDTLTPASYHDDIRAVLSESLTNVVRHAHADRVDVEVAVTDGWLSVRVADDGVGMSEATRDSGLANLRSRAIALGGRMVVESSPGTGTSLVWTIPLDGGSGGI